MPSEEKKNVTPYVEFDSLLDQKPDEQPVANEITEPVLSRPERERRSSDYHREWATITNFDLNELNTVKKALASPDKAKWMTALERNWNPFA